MRLYNVKGQCTMLIQQKQIYLVALKNEEKELGVLTGRIVTDMSEDTCQGETK